MPAQQINSITELLVAMSGVVEKLYAIKDRQDLLGSIEQSLQDDELKFFKGCMACVQDVGDGQEDLFAPQDIWQNKKCKEFVVGCYVGADALSDAQAIVENENSEWLDFQGDHEEEVSINVDLDLISDAVLAVSLGASEEEDQEDEEEEDTVALAGLVPEYEGMKSITDIVGETQIAQVAGLKAAAEAALNTDMEALDTKYPLLGIGTALAKGANWGALETLLKAAIDKAAVDRTVVLTGLAALVPAYLTSANAEIKAIRDTNDPTPVAMAKLVTAAKADGSLNGYIGSLLPIPAELDNGHGALDVGKVAIFKELLKDGIAQTAKKRATQLANITKFVNKFRSDQFNGWWGSSVKGILGAKLIENLEKATTLQDFTNAESVLTVAVTKFLKDNKDDISKAGVAAEVQSALEKIIADAEAKSPALKISALVDACMVHVRTQRDNFLIDLGTMLDIRNAIDTYALANIPAGLSLTTGSDSKKAFDAEIDKKLKEIEDHKDNLHKLVNACIKAPDIQSGLNRYIDDYSNAAASSTLQIDIDKYIASSDGVTQKNKYGFPHMVVGSTSQDAQDFKRILDNAIVRQTRIANLVMACLKNASTEIDALKTGGNETAIDSKITIFENSNYGNMPHGLKLGPTGSDDSDFRHALAAAILRAKNKTKEDIIAMALAKLDSSLAMKNLNAATPTITDTELEKLRVAARQYVEDVLGSSSSTSTDPIHIALRNNSEWMDTAKSELEAHVATVAARKAWEKSTPYKSFLTACAATGDGKYKDLIEKRQAAIKHLKEEILTDTPSGFTGFFGKKLTVRPEYLGAKEAELIRSLDEQKDKAKVCIDTNAALQDLKNSSFMKDFIKAFTIESADFANIATLKKSATAYVEKIIPHPYSDADSGYLKKVITDVDGLFKQLINLNEIKDIKDSVAPLTLTALQSLELKAKQRLPTLIQSSYPNAEHCKQELEKTITNLVINVAVRDKIKVLLDSPIHTAQRIKDAEADFEKELKKQYPETIYNEDIKEALKKFAASAKVVEDIIAQAAAFAELFRDSELRLVELTTEAEIDALYGELSAVYTKLMELAKQKQPDLEDFVRKYLENDLNDPEFGGSFRAKMDDAKAKLAGGKPGKAPEDDSAGSFTLIPGGYTGATDKDFEGLTTKGKYFDAGKTIAKEFAEKGKCIVDVNLAGNPEFNQIHTKRLLTSTFLDKDDSSGTGRKNLSGAVTFSSTEAEKNILKFNSSTNEKDRIRAAVLILRGVVIANKVNGRDDKINAKNFKNDELVKILHKFNKAIFRAHATGKEDALKHFPSVEIMYEKTPPNPEVVKLIEKHNAIYRWLKDNPNTQLDINSSLVKEFQDQLSSMRQEADSSKPIVPRDKIYEPEAKIKGLSEADYKTWESEKKAPKP